MARVLVTGGAGFIGSHTVDRLVAHGHDVTSLDSLETQVHGKDRRPPRWLNPACRYVAGDCRDVAAVTRALEGRTHVLHLAAAVGVGQSMYEITRFTDVNATGTAVLLEAVVAARDRVERLVVASSMSIYGEGLYMCAACGPILRGVARDPGGVTFDPCCPRCGSALRPLSTPEEKAIEPASIYAAGKYYQEVACLTAGASYGIPAIALRYFNVYGPRQSLSNPYTGVASIFCSRILNGNPPHLYEDGRQRRDFVHVSDVAQANELALLAPRSVTGPLNIGSGVSRSVLDVAHALIARLRPGLQPTVAFERRAGDTRHCFADVKLARASLGYAPAARFEDTVDDLVRAALQARTSAGEARDGFDAHRRDLLARGLAA
jgi:dTDP-L-rhamnose 4-epimerase